MALPESAITKSKVLTAAFVSNAKEPGKYHDGKGTGLFLLVKPTGGSAKQNRPHRVPLSGRALALLAEAVSNRDASGLIFPSLRGKGLSDMTLSKPVKELGFDADVHGFRTSFRTWGQERTNYPREVQKAALSHKKGDVSEQAYAMSDLFEKRRNMMESWARAIARSERNRMPERILRRPEVESRTGLPRSTIYQEMSEGLFPKPVRLGKRAVGWSESVVLQWLADRPNTDRAAG